jgi:hypothetical protein
MSDSSIKLNSYFPTVDFETSNPTTPKKESVPKRMGVVILLAKPAFWVVLPSRKIPIISPVLFKIYGN